MSKYTFCLARREARKFTRDNFKEAAVYMKNDKYAVVTTGDMTMVRGDWKLVLFYNYLSQRKYPPTTTKKPCKEDKEVLTEK